MKLLALTILIVFVSACAIHTSRHVGKTVSLGIGKTESFGDRRQSLITVLEIDAGGAVVEVGSRKIKERTRIIIGGFAETSLFGSEAIQLVSLDGKRNAVKAVFKLRWAEHRGIYANE